MFLFGFFVAGFTSFAAQANLAGDWPTFGNGPAHTGYFPGKLNGLPFVFKWNRQMPSDGISQPAVAGGRVFVSVASRRTVATADGRAYFVGDKFYCVNLSTRTNEWAVSGSFGWTPVVANGTVYVISNETC